MSKAMEDGRVLAWGGFVDGLVDQGGFRLDSRTHPSDGALTPLFAVFRTRKAARRQFQDVRRVEIREVGKKPRKVKR